MEFKWFQTFQRGRRQVGLSHGGGVRGWDKFLQVLPARAS